MGRILIIGGGPAGLGAAWRLHEAGRTDWELFEKDLRVGGLAASHVDAQGFTWDLGGHVVFSHYEYFDRLLDALLEQEWVEHIREAWIWMRDRFIPYPLQNNIRHLPTSELLECLEGLLDVRTTGQRTQNGGCKTRDRGQQSQDRERGVDRGARPSALLGHPSCAVRPQTFADWIVRSFGAGLARVFLYPYNWKVWATDPAEMSAAWVAERVAPVDLKRILRNVIEGRDDLGWGPNATFRFPLHGGTGRIWQALAQRLPADRVHLGTEVVAIDTQQKIVSLSDGGVVAYDWLITTMPLDLLLNRISGLESPLGNSAGKPVPTDPSQSGAERVGWASPGRSDAVGSDAVRRSPAGPDGHTTDLRHSSTHAIGVGLAGPVPEHLATKCWIYFPEPELPFYRVTVFSNYAPHNVPQPGRQWSLLAEVSESAARPVDAARVVPQTVDGLKQAGLLGPEATIESLWHRRLEQGYPIPSLGRDDVLARIEPALRARNILSRGRFGAWKYEVGNMDHSFMQGVEAVNHILCGTPEVTLRSPAVVNAPKHADANRS
jgi:protoporphyrinogen oxidase